jgi:hypothetical protein
MSRRLNLLFRDGCHLQRNMMYWCESDNYFTALGGEETGEVNGEAKAAWTEDCAGGPSEAPSIKSPHKARASGTSNNRQHTAGGHQKFIWTTKRKGNKVLGFETPETTTKQKEMW